MVGCPFSYQEVYLRVLMADAVNRHAYWLLAEFDTMNAVEIDGWRLEEWPDVKGG